MVTYTKPQQREYGLLSYFDCKADRGAGVGGYEGASMRFSRR